MRTWRLLGLLGAALAVAAPGAWAQSGAKALFYGASGSTVQPGAQPSAARPARPAGNLAGTHMGVRWWVELQDRNGQMRRVTTDHRFRAGDRIKLYVQSNRDGYLSLVNIGSTNRTTMLYPSAAAGSSNAIQANVVTEIPPGSFIRFDANPGEETLLLILSPTPIGAPAMPGATTAAAGGAPPPPPLPAPATSFPSPPPAPLPQDPAVASTPGGLPAPPPPSAPLPGSFPAPAGGPPPGAGGTSAEEAARLVNAALAKGAKDLIVEADPASAQPASYAVAPASSLAGGGMITVRIKLKHD